MKFSKIQKGLAVGLITAVAPFASDALAEQIKVTITSNSPANGIRITPVWVGFHNGSFDSYDGGSAAAAELERLAEDGNTGLLSGVFNANGTLAPNAVVQVGSRVDATVPGVGGPLATGETVMATFTIDPAGANQFFSYAAMVLPSSDYFIANGNPLAHDLGSLAGAAVGTTITFDIGLPGAVNDAGTEVNDFATSAGNGLFPQLNLPGGQGGPNTGADQNGVVANVAGIPYTGFLNTPGDLDTNPSAGLINFNDAAIYPHGLATVSISVIPEPASAALLALGSAMLLPRRRRRH